MNRIGDPLDSKGVINPLVFLLFVMTKAAAN